MSSTYFIADLHLDTARPHVVDGLASFLTRIAGCDALYILGDLFEAWVGDDDDAPLATDVAMLLRNFVSSGPALYLQHGNRDFLIGRAFAERTAGTLIPDPTQIDLYGTPTLLLHGDSLCTADVAYQRYRTKARDPQWQAELLSRPLQERREIADKLRRISGEATSNKASDITDVTPQAVEDIAHEYGVKRVIHGHTHRPGRHPMSFGERWVLGDWDTQGWCLQVSTSGIELKNFPIFQ